MGRSFAQVRPARILRALREDFPESHNSSKCVRFGETFQFFSPRDLTKRQTSFSFPPSPIFSPSEVGLLLRPHVFFLTFNGLQIGFGSSFLWYWTFFFEPTIREPSHISTTTMRSLFLTGHNTPIFSVFLSLFQRLFGGPFACFSSPSPPDEIRPQGLNASPPARAFSAAVITWSWLPTYCFFFLASPQHRLFQKAPRRGLAPFTDPFVQLFLLDGVLGPGFRITLFYSRASPRRELILVAIPPQSPPPFPPRPSRLFHAAGPSIIPSISAFFDRRAALRPRPGRGFPDRRQRLFFLCLQKSPIFPWAAPRLSYKVFFRVRFCLEGVPCSHRH